MKDLCVFFRLSTAVIGGKRCRVSSPVIIPVFAPESCQHSHVWVDASGLHRYSGCGKVRSSEAEFRRPSSQIIWCRLKGFRGEVTRVCAIVLLCLQVYRRGASKNFGGGH